MNAPRWSPDGSHLVFWTDHVNPDTGQVDGTSVFTFRADGSGLQQLTHSTTPNDRATQPRFTPDGRIIYTRVTPGGRTLWLIDADGSNASPIPAGGQRIRTHGDWQPTA